ncbi:hypothetical protein Dcar01_03802 [Deinococcus carri]|uniref:DUF1049 domain-containing protein n=1 Tax=Deinococcus carri TaxID=1211323 RepID=A0ABP9WCI8_9DEIO
MGNLNRVLLFFGIVLTGAAGVLLAKSIIEINQLTAAAVGTTSPGLWSQALLLAAGLALVAGFLLGLGLALRTSRRPMSPAGPPRS